MCDMIRIRENCFDQIVDEKSHKFYANADKFVAVIFDPLSLASVWKELEAANTSSLPVSLYVFSYSQYAYEDEIPETHLEYKSIPIPESILEYTNEYFANRRTVMYKLVDYQQRAVEKMLRSFKELAVAAQGAHVTVMMHMLESSSNRPQVAAKPS